MGQRTIPVEGTTADREGSTPSIRVTCYARASTLAAPVDDTVREFERLQREGRIQGFDVTVWPDSVAVDGDSEALEAFERFRAWAHQYDVRVSPPFEVRTRTSEFTGETTETLVTPVLFVAIYAEGALVAVYPHSVGERTHTVADAIEALELGTIDALGTGTRPATAPGVGHCPECGTYLVNGQGVFFCSDCEWVGTITEAGRYRREPSLSPGSTARERFVER